MWEEFKMVSRFVTLLSVVMLGACSQSGYSIQQTETGYSISNLPQEFLAEFEGQHQMRMTIDPKDSESTSVIGQVSVADGALIVETTEKLGVLSLGVDDWLYIGSVEPVADGGWTGCPTPGLEEIMRLWRPTSKICYCLHGPMPDA